MSVNQHISFIFVVLATSGNNHTTSISFQHLIFYKGLSISLNSCMVPLLILNSLYVYERHVYVDVNLT